MMVPLAIAWRWCALAALAVVYLVLLGLAVALLEREVERAERD